MSMQAAITQARRRLCNGAVYGRRYHRVLLGARTPLGLRTTTIRTMATAEETAIQRVVKTWYDGWNAQDMEVSAKVATEDMRFIRPSGNPASMAVFDAMSKSDDVTDSKTEILGFEKVHVGADSAMCCITHHDTFKYKGTQNDDVAVSTFYLTKVGGSWKIKWAQRSTGRAPTEPKPEDF